jgi:hypothetical protein
MNKYLKLILETLPVFVGILFSCLFWQDNLLLFFIYLAMSVGLIYLHKDKDEIIIFAYGVAVGLFVEVTGTKVGGYQSFTQPDFMGIPFWLLFAWGYGFVAMKRVGFAIKNL